VAKSVVLVLALLSLVLGGCADALPPSEGAPAAAGPGGGLSPRVAFCYNRLTTTLHRLEALAAEACGPGSEPRPVEDKDMVLSACPITTPARMTFACLK